MSHVYLTDKQRLLVPYFKKNVLEDDGDDDKDDQGEEKRVS